MSAAYLLYLDWLDTLHRHALAAGLAGTAEATGRMLEAERARVQA